MQCFGIAKTRLNISPDGCPIEKASRFLEVFIRILLFKDAWDDSKMRLSVHKNSS